MLSVVYALTAASGPFAILSTPASMVETIGPTAASLWGVYVLAGATGCLVGVVRSAWVWEFACIPLLVSALTVYGVVVGRTTSDAPGRTSAALLLLGFAALLVVVWLQRWREGRGDAHRVRSQNLGE